MLLGEKQCRVNTAAIYYNVTYIIMSLPLVGKLSIRDIRNKFANSKQGPHKLGEFYEGAAHVPTVAQGLVDPNAIPTSGRIRIGNFRGANVLAGVTLYDGSGGTGVHETYLTSQNTSTYFNDRAVSVNVPQGYKVRLYQHFNEGGGYIEIVGPITLDFSGQYAFMMNQVSHVKIISTTESLTNGVVSGYLNPANGVVLYYGVDTQSPIAIQYTSMGMYSFAGAVGYIRVNNVAGQQAKVRFSTGANSPLPNDYSDSNNVTLLLREGDFFDVQGPKETYLAIRDAGTNVLHSFRCGFNNITNLNIYPSTDSVAKDFFWRNEIRLDGLTYWTGITNTYGGLGSYSIGPQGKLFVNAVGGLTTFRMIQSPVNVYNTPTATGVRILRENGTILGEIQPGQRTTEFSLAVNDKLVIERFGTFSSTDYFVVFLQAFREIF